MNYIPYLVMNTCDNLPHISLNLFLSYLYEVFQKQKKTKNSKDLKCKRHCTERNQVKEMTMLYKIKKKEIK